jgi:hypothetical protein
MSTTPSFHMQCNDAFEISINPVKLKPVFVSNQTGKKISFDFAKIIGMKAATIEADFSVGFISITRYAKQNACQIRPHQKMLAHPVILAQSCQTENSR